MAVRLLVGMCMHGCCRINRQTRTRVMFVTCRFGLPPSWLAGWSRCGLNCLPTPPPGRTTSCSPVLP